MMNYNELYTLYEDHTDLHPNILETSEAEHEVASFLHTLDHDTAFQVDDLIGQIARAYEMQGFLFGLNYSRTH